MLPLATYRLQMRNGVDFDTVIADIDALTRLGISHLYLSPVFTATTGSTHGYDVTRPDEIDPALGGLEGFRRLAEAARARGLGIILDIVPNHTAFSLENPWLVDVLRHGQASRYAQHFDIDWSAGRLVLPWLARPVQALLAEGALHVGQDARLGPVLVVDDLRLPLQGDTQGPLEEVLERQSWHLADWQAGSDSITHRRFFNITDLISMRVDRPEVFDDTHALVLDLVARGDVQGLRIDHIDGLRAPGAYLERLRGRVGPDVPIWVEKILVGDEPLPDWPVEGTTGYEHARDIARVLTPPAGVAALGALWSGAVARGTDYAATLTAAKRDILRHDLAAEVLRLVDLARAALKDDPEHDPGPETLRQSVIGMLEGMPVYRTYFGEAHQAAEDAAAPLDAMRAHVAATLRPPLTALRLIDVLAEAQSPEEAAFRDLFQQTSGAVLAKSAEDTALYRFVPYPAACEVGASPEAPTLPPEEFAQTWASMPAGAMVLTSTHDTKRSEDARMRLVACAVLPDAVQVLWHETCALPRVQAALAGGMRKEELWTLMHSLLAAWQPADLAPDLAERVAGYLQKAMREAKEISVPGYPNDAAEAPALGLARALTVLWQANLPEAAAALIDRGEVLSLVQLALKLLARGVPDIYRGCEGPSFSLTDPDNRRAVDLKALSALDQQQDFAGRKYRLTRSLLSLRARRISDLRGAGGTQVEAAGRGYLVRRQTASGVICAEIRPGREPVLRHEADEQAA
ncbi:malto-oligosyltrehalose synthase [Pseudotabrizicola algicola]|uniref:Malto-oligosyltrehalose synthase n=1 Tax=Pseudotabrizicola algicola TaxID=2709381 RepID=A0A6B3RNV8_9RHOB|nr:malto-oligosyltrehalose synthase [Pseudotabrizicola algicola]NEX47787.1 malto-oligosyltrehalose synthase [Pseudotabrizicola algicola]